jgi:CubicO group peptidase (beta-lactamase class C family)
MKIIYSIACFSSCFALATDGASQQKVLNKKTSPFDHKFSELVKNTLEKWHVPGLAIGVVDGDDSWTEGYGIASYPSTPVTPSTLFYAGSTTKAFTAAVMSLLVDDDANFPHVKWSTPISSLIRGDFVLEDEWATNHVTIEDALSHRTGMPAYDGSYGGHYDGHEATVRDVVRSLRHLPLIAEPRTKFQYCNMMFVVVSHVIETLTGTWLGTILKNRILDPLGMMSTYFSLPAAINSPENLATGYYYHNRSYNEVPFMPLVEVSGAGSIISNVEDYTRWMRCLLFSSGPISKAGYEAIRSPRIFIENPERSGFDGTMAYALGWMMNTYKGHPFLTHSGGMEAYGAEVYLFPDLKYGIVTFGNTAVTSNAAGEALLWHLVDEKLGIPAMDRYDWNGKWENIFKKRTSKIEYALDDLYPDRADPPLPPTLPIKKYTGTYFHTAYRNITLNLPPPAFDPERLNNRTLVADRSDSTWQSRLEFRHVSGEYWIVYLDSLHAPESVFQEVAAARFNIGVDGKPDKLGINWQEALEGTREVSVWFDRIE